MRRPSVGSAGWAIAIFVLDISTTGRLLFWMNDRSCYLLFRRLESEMVEIEAASSGGPGLARLERGDEELVERFFGRLSADSPYRRFFTSTAWSALRWRRSRAARSSAWRTTRAGPARMRRTWRSWSPTPGRGRA